MERPMAEKRMMGRRAHYACVRCRRQKLRCDDQRPCALCVRSCVECEEGEMPKRKRRDKSDLQTLRESAPGNQFAYSPTGSVEQHPANSSGSLNSESTTSTTFTRGQQDALQMQEEVPTFDQNRPSTYGLADQLLKGLDSRWGALTDIDAIPDATSAHFPSTSINGQLARIADLVGCELPDSEVSMMLFDVFIKSVHWFMMVFHEPSLRTELQSVLKTGYIAQRKLSTALLILVILLLGTKYTTTEEISTCCPKVDLAYLRSKLLETIEARFLAILDQDDAGAVQVCILLSSYYFYHGRPNRCLALNGAAIRIAQSLKFDRESSWGRIDPIEREVRRRVWWALYVLNGHAALTYGRINIIQDARSQVGLPQNIDDSSDRCPGFGSHERVENETLQEVTTLSYQRYKFRLYCIADPIMREIYSPDQGPVQDLVKRVQEINTRLVDWEKSLPPELKLESFRVGYEATILDSATRTFQLQALALQLSYDNIQLILHRRLLLDMGVLCRGPLRSRPRSIITTEVCDEFWAMSKEQCWKSAKRTSSIDQYPSILEQMRSSPAAGYAGIQAFNAGVMLGIFALSEPLSPQAQEAKCGIGRIIKMQKLNGYRTKMSIQTGRILERLLRLVLDGELEMLVSENVALPVFCELEEESSPSAAFDTVPSVLSCRPVYSNAVSGSEVVSNNVLTDHAMLENGLRYSNEASQASFANRSVDNNSSVQQLAYGSVTDEFKDAGGWNQQNSRDGLEAMSFDSNIGGAFFHSDLLSELDQLGQRWFWEQPFQFS